MKRKTNLTGVVLLLVVGAAGVFGVSWYLKDTPEARTVPVGARRQEPQTRVSERAPDHSTQTQSVSIFTPRATSGDWSFDQRTEEVPVGTAPIVFAVNRYLEQLPFVPSRARAVAVEVKDRVAYIDCTEAMEKTYGSSDEGILLQGLGRTVGQFPDVDRMEFLVSGTPIDSFGNVDASQGLDVIRPEKAGGA